LNDESSHLKQEIPIAINLKSFETWNFYHGNSAGIGICHTAKQIA
jgi:hypothetical protein